MANQGFGDLSDYKRNELEVIDLLNEIEGFEAYPHPLERSHYDVGVKARYLILDKVYPVWKCSYFKEDSEGCNLLVEVKNRSKLYANYYLEFDKAKGMHQQMGKDRSSRPSIPLYCCSYYEDNGDKVHLIYDVRWIVDQGKLQTHRMNDQTVFNGKKAYTGESRQGNKKEKKVYSFPSNGYFLKLQKGKPAELNKYMYEQVGG